MSWGTNNTLADSTLDVVTLKASETDSADLVEVDAFDGNGDAGEVFNVLTVGTDHNDGVTVSTGVELVSVTDTSETLSGCCVEVSASGRDVVAYVIGLPLTGSAGDSFVGAASVGEEIVVGGISTGETETSEGIKGSAEITGVPALSEMEILSAGAAGVGEAGVIDQSITQQAS